MASSSRWASGTRCCTTTPLCEGGVIKKIAPAKAFRGTYTKVIDAGGKLVLPGFINTHMHFYSTMVRGLGKAAPLQELPGDPENLWWRLDKKLTLADSYYSALLPLIDAIKRGTTTLIDHHASPMARADRWTGSPRRSRRPVCAPSLL